MNENLQQFEMTQKLIAIENFYDDISNNRFSNAPDYQRKVKLIQKTIAGRSKMLVLLSRFNANK